MSKRRKGKKRTKRELMLHVAAKASPVARFVAGTKWSAKAQRAFNARKGGKFGAASSVRVLMKDGVPMESEADDKRDEAGRIRNPNAGRLVAGPVRVTLGRAIDEMVRIRAEVRGFTVSGPVIDYGTPATMTWEIESPIGGYTLEYTCIDGDISEREAPHAESP